MKTICFSLLLVGIASAIVFGGNSGGSSSCSSEEFDHEGHGHGGHGHGGHGHGRPPPPPPRPTRPECESGWSKFDRPNGVWCIFIGDSGVTNGYQSQQQAESVCASKGATLTGFQNANERMSVANVALKRLNMHGLTIGGLWLGATNNPGCKQRSCGPHNTFRWTDGHTTGIGGFKWGVGEPDNVNWPGPTICIQQFIRSPNWTPGPQDSVNWRAAFAHGDLDKYQCGAPAHPVARFYACGKRAVIR